MLVVEHLFLLLRRDDGKAESVLGWNTYGLCGAVLTDLLLAGHIAVDDRKDPRVSVTTADPVGHPVLDAALERVRQREGKKLSSLVTDGRLDPEENVAQSLARAGVITIEPKRALGLISARYPVIDPGPERRLRERLRAVLAGADAQPHEAALLSFLKSMDLAGQVLKDEKGDLSRKELSRRIDEISAEEVIGKAVAKAIEAVNAAVMVAVFTATLGAASS